MEVDDLLPEYREGQLVGWFCFRRGRMFDRDHSVPETDDIARVRAEFLDHTCSPSEDKNHVTNTTPVTAQVPLKNQREEIVDVLMRIPADLAQKCGGDFAALSISLG